MEQKKQNAAKQWKDYTPKEKRRFGCISAVATVVILCILLGFLMNNDEHNSETYISNIKPSELTNLIESEGYNVERVFSDSCYIWKFSRTSTTCAFRIQIYSPDDVDRYSAIRVEAMSSDANIAKIDEVKQEFKWMASQGNDSTELQTWIDENINKDGATFINAGNKYVISAPDKYLRKIDIFKANRDKSPIPEDGLFFAQDENKGKK